MWDERYNIEHYFYGKMPNDFLVSSANEIPKGKVLCLAEGEGRNSVFLARLGYEVVGVDFSQVGLDKAEKLAQDNRVEVTYHCADLTTYDIEPASYEGVVSIFCHFPSEARKAIYERVVEGLKPGGVLVLEAYTPSQLALGTGGPKDIDYLATLRTLQTEISGLEWTSAQETERIIMEGIGHSGPSAVVQMIGVKKA